MTKADWERLQTLFAKLIELPACQREICAEASEANVVIRREALALAAADHSEHDPVQAYIIQAMSKFCPSSFREP